MSESLAQLSLDFFTFLGSFTPLAVTDGEARLLEINDRFKNLLGLESSEIGKTDLRAFFSSETERGPVRELHKHEIQLRTRSGFDLWLEMNVLSHPTKKNTYLWIGFDVSERKATEKFLADSQLFSKALMQSAPIGLFIANPSGACTFVNNSWTKQSGTQSSKVRLNGWQANLHPEDKAKVIESWNGLIKDHKPFQDLQYRYVQADGSEVWVLCSAVILKDVDMGIAGFLRMEQDITARLQNERTIQDQQGVIISNAKLSSLGEMAGGIAHEINTPLASIQLRAELLNELMIDSVPDPETIRETTDSILKTVSKISQIVKGLRIFARDGKRDPAAITDMKTVVDETFALCRQRFHNHQVKLSFAVNDSDSADPYVECRQTEISQVLLNLINNSFDAVQKFSEKWVKVELTLKESEIELSVLDSGRGIPKEIQSKMMQPFFTTKDIGKGTGLGLSISRGIILGHGGEIFIDNSCPNTKFTIRLPRKQKAQAA